MTAFRKRKPPTGARPGTLAIPEDAAPPKIRLIRYDEDNLYEKDVDSAEEISRQLKGECRAWVDVQGLGDEALLWSLAKKFKIHPLALEDVVHVPQRPKTESYAEHQLFILRMVRLDENEQLSIEQVTLLVSTNRIVSFQEHYGDVLDPVRKRLRDPNSLVRKSGPDYLAYAIIDTIVDGYFPVIEWLGECLEVLENGIMHRPEPEHLREINRIKATLMLLRRSLWPLRDLLSGMVRDPNPFIKNETRLYFRDTYDHAIQIVEVLESHREMASGFMNTYLSVVSNRTNDVMKVLTIMASIFIPLTFMAGIYGMNFEHMPELRMRWAYPALWGAMVTVAGGLFIFFRRKGWLG